MVSPELMERFLESFRPDNVTHWFETYAGVRGEMMNVYSQFKQYLRSLRVYQEIEIVLQLQISAYPTLNELKHRINFAKSNFQMKYFSIGEYCEENQIDLKTIMRFLEEDWKRVWSEVHYYQELSFNDFRKYMRSVELCKLNGIDIYSERFLKKIYG